MYCDHQCQGWRRSKQGRFGIKSLVVAAAFAAFVFSPASAKMMPCTGENIAKITASIDTMPETPRKMAMIKEIGMANTDMSNGNMRSACRHYMNAQKTNGM
jgi:hypothetical protein